MNRQMAVKRHALGGVKAEEDLCWQYGSVR